VRAILRALPLFVLLFLARCSGDNTFTGQCQADSECPIGAFCRAGLCACRSNEACEVGQFCNRQGICQKIEGCRGNADCSDKEFCDIATGKCLPRTSCGSDVHCIPGTVCQRSTSTCVNGCFDDGDCPLYAICQRAGTSTSVPGTCIAGRCSSPAFCAYGQSCTNNACVNDPNPNHCAACSGQPNDCGSPANYCLVNPNYDPARPQNGSEFFCGVDCKDTQQCPSGYGCGSIILLTQDQCTTADCAGNPNCCGGDGRECRVGEGDQRGFCTCASDEDCNVATEIPPTCAKTCGGFGIQQCTRNDECLSGNCVPTACIAPSGRMCQRDDECEPAPLCGDYLGLGTNICITSGRQCASNEDCICSGNRCINTGRPCNTAQDCRLTCRDQGCYLGDACVPQAGLSCEDVR
jgi:hypothetical protein